MSIILKSTEMHIKNSNTNEYQTINVLAEQSADEAIARVESAKNTAISNIQTKASETTSEYPTNEEVAAMLAPIFSESTVYNTGDYVRYTTGTVAKLYRITADHVAGTTWANTSKVEVNLGDEIGDLNNDLSNSIKKLNAHNFLINCNPFSAGDANVVFTPTADGSIYIIGTSGGSGSFYNFYYNTTGGLPNFLKPGEKYVLKYSSVNVEFDVWFYKNGTYQTGLARKTNGSFIVPSDATGCVIRLKIEPGVTVNETVHPMIINCMTNQEITEIIENAPFSKGKMLSIGNSIMTGSVYNNGVYSHICDYNDAPYAQIAKRLGISQNNITHQLYSSAGLLAENNNNNSFLKIIKKTSLYDYDYLLTHLWISDMNNYQLGTIDSISGDGTIAGAVLELINYIISSNEKCRLILVSVPPVSPTIKGNNVFTGIFSNKKNINDLDELMALFAKKYQFMYLNWQMLNISYNWDNYRSSLTDVHASDSNTYRIMGEYLADNLNYGNAEFFTNTRIMSHGEPLTGSGNPIILYGTKAVNQIKSLTIENAEPGNIMSISGKNIYYTTSDMQQRINNGVTYQFINQQIIVSSQGASANSVSSGDNFNSKYSTINGVSWWHNYKFMVSHDTTVTVSLNASKTLLYNSLIQGQISDGTTTLFVDNNDLTFVAKANIEYGFRLAVQTGFSGEIIIKPQIEFNTYATAYERFKGGRYTISGNGTFYNANYPIQEGTSVIFVHNGSANLIISTIEEGIIEKTNLNNEEAKKIARLTFGKVPFTAPRKPLVSFIDDDTSSLSLIERYHDIFTAENVMGGYAIMTKNLADQTGLKEKLLEYEQEGFSCLYHCYYQSGDSTRYWEAENSAYDEELIKENFMRGLRDMCEYGFSAYKYWVTPYGVGDNFIQKLAKTHDIPCLFVMGGNIIENSFVNINGNCNRYGIPRISISTSSIQSRTKKIIDACIAAKGWLTIVTHVNSWDNTTTMDNKLTEIIQYCKTNGAEIVSVPEAFNQFKPYFYWSELLN